MDKKMSRDLLSDLPLGIIHIILSFVPIRDAIGTSLLSKQWRYIWTGLPNLVFDAKCIKSLLENDGDEKKVIHFVNQALLLHKGPIHKFELHLPAMVNHSYCVHQWLPTTEESQLVDQWLLFFSRSDIRILVIFIVESSYAVHSSLYSCQSLTDLRLFVDNIPPLPPSFKGFLFLRSLDIFVSEGDFSAVESIVAHSPLLEDLTLDSDPSLDITIRAPNLKYFHLKSLSESCDNLSLCTPLLEEFVGPISLIKLFEESSVFCHLRRIKLSYFAHSDRKVLPVVVHLIKGAPNLQQLEILGHFHWTFYDPELDSVSFWNMEFAPYLTYDSLKVIKIEYFGGYIDEMKLIEFLLARSPVLVKMIYNREWDLPDKMLLKIRAQLLKFHRASANAEIVVRRDMI